MNDEFNELMHTLNRLFWTLTAIAVVFLGLGYLRHRLEITIPVSVGNPKVWGILLLVLAALLGVALPILLRTLFNKRAVTAKHVDKADFAAHQRRLVAIPVCAAYAAGVAYFLALTGLYLYGTVLCGLYGIYSALPQERKLKGEMRYYGLVDK
jgi:predicted secreted protein